jgi:outer membrane immunogenic protein
MRKLLLGGIAFSALLAGPATAADLGRPVYRRPVVVAPVYSWTGFYVGGNLGYSWGRARTDIAGSGTSVSFRELFGGVRNSPAAFADSQTQRLNGVVGGGQVGYNYQFSPKWLLGLEADIQGSGERGSNTFADPLLGGTVCTGVLVVGGTITCIGGPFNSPLNGAAVTAYEARIGWFGTVRGRLGFLITDQVLLYGTGGLAYGRVELSGNTSVSGTVVRTVAGFTDIFPITPGTTAFSQSKTNVGIAVGGGIEGKCSHWLPTGWTWKAEYLYVDLGSLDTVAPFPLGPVPPGVTTPFAGAITTHTRFTDNIVRVGLNYKFGYAAAPAVYK